MRKTLPSILCCLFFVATAVAVRAAELVTFRSGFSVRCTSRENISPVTVRLHMPSSEGSAENFMDVAASSIASVETAPPEPVTVATPKAAAHAPDIFTQSAASYNVNVALLASVAQAESGGNPRAVSRAGARGLMQLMPATAAGLGVHDSFEPAQNLDGGSAYLDQLLTRYHDDLPLALAAYNAGPAAVDRYHGVPPYRETRTYVARVIREFNRRVKLRMAANVTAASGSLVP